MMEMIKKVPIPIWIGLGLVLILIFVMNSRNQKQSQQMTAPAGPVTTATVGTQGAQTNPGTDQEIANLSVMTQSGFAQIATLEKTNTDLLKQIGGNMNGVGTTMQQFGGAIQQTQNSAAAANASGGTTGQNTGSNPNSVG